MKQIDCLGEFCPVPILKIKAELKKTEKGESFLVITDHSCVLQSIHDHFKQSDIRVEADEVMNGVWEVIITKG